VLALGQGGVATSGRDFRRWEAGSDEAHHLIDPRTGAPSTSEVLTATVVADTAVTAEVAAKVVVLLGASEGLAWLDRRGLGGVAVFEDGKARHNARFEEQLWR
jgi:FAD:protein FMN transferase